MTHLPARRLHISDALTHKNASQVAGLCVQAAREDDESIACMFVLVGKRTESGGITFAAATGCDKQDVFAELQDALKLFVEGRNG